MYFLPAASCFFCICICTWSFTAHCKLKNSCQEMQKAFKTQIHSKEIFFIFAFVLFFLIYLFFVPSVFTDICSWLFLSTFHLLLSTYYFPLTTFQCTSCPLLTARCKLFYLLTFIIEATSFIISDS